MTPKELKELGREFSEDILDMFGGLKGYAKKAKTLAKTAWKNLLKYKKDINATLLLVFIAVIIYSSQLSYTYLYISFLIYCIAGFPLKIRSNTPIIAALILLAITPIFLIKGFENYANYIAIMAYFFLVIGVVRKFIAYVMEK